MLLRNSINLTGPSERGFLGRLRFWRCKATVWICCK